MEKRNIDKTLTKDQINYLSSLGVEFESNSSFSALGLDVECARFAYEISSKVI